MQRSLREFLPKSYQYIWGGYSFSTFRKDLIAGLTVGIIALPLAMAFAIASGVGPERGLFTAIVAGFLISALGGSRIQIGGPTGAFVVIVFDVVMRTGYAGLCTSTLIAAVILVGLGLFRFGSWIKYVPYPLITGFTTGIAVIIFSTQIKDFFGLQMNSVPAGFTEKWLAYFHALPTMDSWTFGLGAATLTVILLVRRLIPSLPWGITAIVLATGVAIAFHLPVETIASRFGTIPRMLPVPTVAGFASPTPEIIMDAITIAFLGGIESLLSCVIGDGMIGGRHRSNCELIAQGIANFASILFGGIPATGAIARTATNVKSGAMTPMAGMIHAITLLLIMLVAAPIVSQIPLAALAAVLIMVSWNMSEAGHFIRLFKAPMEDRLVLLTAFLLTVFVDITTAIFAGMILASLLFMKRMSELSKAEVFIDESSSDLKEAAYKAPPGVEIYEIQGPFFFGAAHMLKDLSPPTVKTFILRMRHVPLIDASGIYALKEFSERCKKENVRLILSGVQEPVKHRLHKFGLHLELAPHIAAALERRLT